MFGIDLIDASLLPAMLVALAAGIVSFLSPCVLPIVPPYLAFMSGVSIAEMEAGGRARLRAFLAALFFVLGLSTVFVLLGFTASWLGMFFLQNQVLLARISGVVVIVFGLHFLHVFRIPFLDREARIETGDTGGSAFGAYLLGLAFAFGWTPCVGPALASILMIASGMGDIVRGGLLLLVYGIGMTAPFVIAALFSGPFLRWTARHRGKLQYVEKAMGVMLILFAILIATDSVNVIAQWMIDTFPGWTSLS